MKKRKNEVHNFALYWPNLVSLDFQNQALTITDKDLIHRVIRVLRLQHGDTFVLFDKTNNVLLSLQECDKASIKVRILKQQKNIVLKPHITFLLPLLKKQALEEAIYTLVELGANDIQLMLTKKVQRKWGEQKEQDRLQKIMITAAEQSKNFSIPVLHDPIKFEQVFESIEKQTQHCIFFDPYGQSIPSIMPLLQQEEKPFALMIGPEGDLTLEEKKTLQNNNFIFCRLTPTVLRARQAIVLSLGIIRSFF